MALLGAVLTLGAGCSPQPMVSDALGLRGPYLFYGFDAVARPGVPADVVVRLQKGAYMNDQEGRLVRVVRDGAFVAQAYTDEEGFATMTFTPPRPGDYRLTASVVAGRLEGQRPEDAEILVACRDPNESFVVVDIDKTLVASSFDDVLAGDAKAMPGSVRVLRRLAEKHSILYLTLRPDYFGPKTKQWLAEKGNPRAPLWVSEFHGLLEGNKDYRVERLRRFRRRFPKTDVGIGDKLSSMDAYLANGMAGVLILHPESLDDPSELRARARGLAHFPAGVDVVSNWRDVNRALLEDRRYPPKRMAARLRRLASSREQASTTSR